MTDPFTPLMCLLGCLAETGPCSIRRKKCIGEVWYGWQNWTYSGLAHEWRRRRWMRAEPSIPVASADRAETALQRLEETSMEVQWKMPLFSVFFSWESIRASSWFWICDPTAKVMQYLQRGFLWRSDFIFVKENEMRDIFSLTVKNSPLSEFFELFSSIVIHNRRSISLICFPRLVLLKRSGRRPAAHGTIKWPWRNYKRKCRISIGPFT